MEATVVPFFLRSVGLSASVLQRKESDVLECSVFQGINDQINELEVVKEQMLSPGGSFPLPILCHILKFMLDAALESRQATPTTELMVANGVMPNILWVILFGIFVEL